MRGREVRGRRSEREKPVSNSSSLSLTPITAHCIYTPTPLVIHTHTRTHFEQLIAIRHTHMRMTWRKNHSQSRLP